MAWGFCDANDMVMYDSAAQLREQGVAVLRAVFPEELLTRLNEAATRCFDVIRIGKSLPEHYHFNPFSHSVLLTALLDFGCASSEQLVGPLSVAGLDQLFAGAMGCEWICSMDNRGSAKSFRQFRLRVSRTIPRTGTRTEH